MSGGVNVAVPPTGTDTVYVLPDAVAAVTLRTSMLARTRFIGAEKETEPLLRYRPPPSRDRTLVPSEVTVIPLTRMDSPSLSTNRPLYTEILPSSPMLISHESVEVNE